MFAKRLIAALILLLLCSCDNKESVKFINNSPYDVRVVEISTPDGGVSYSGEYLLTRPVAPAALTMSKDSFQFTSGASKILRATILVGNKRQELALTCKLKKIGSGTCRHHAWIVEEGAIQMKCICDGIRNTD